MTKHQFWIAYVILSLADDCEAFWASSISRRGVYAKHSYVEDEDYTNQFDELEALGGDPFFLSGNDDDQGKNFQSSSDVMNNFDYFSHLSSTLPFGARGVLQHLNQGATPPDMFNHRKTRSGEDTRNTKRQSESDAIVEDSVADENIPLWGEFDMEDDAFAIFGVDPTFITGSSPKADEEQFENELDEILFLGGDPAFFGPEGPESAISDANDEVYDELLANGGDPFFLDESQGENDFKMSLAMDINDVAIAKDDTPFQMEVLSKLVDLSYRSDPGALPGSKNVIGIGSSSSYESQQSLLQEIDELGGDDFFLEVAETTTAELSEKGQTPEATSSSVATGSRRVKDGRGPSPKIFPAREKDDNEWKWDGVVDEDAHLDLE